ncbi:hypothetical protein R2Q93_00890 [Clostridium perfringens]|nr:hypothetical protein [Clostridium perfringens]
MKKARSNSKKFRLLQRIEKLAKEIDDILSWGNQAGEEWLLSSEIIELLKSGVSNMICI